MGGKRIVHRAVRIRRHAGGNLGDIQRRAAAETDDKVLAASCSRGGLDGSQLRLAGKSAEELHRYLFGIKLGGQPLTEPAGSKKPVHDDKHGAGTKCTRGCGDGFMNPFAKTDLGHERRCEPHGTSRMDLPNRASQFQIFKYWDYSAFLIT
jgi:hypothetical protein